MNRAETVFQNPVFSDDSFSKVNNFTGADLSTNTYYFKAGQGTDYQSAQQGDQVYVVLTGQGQFYLNNGMEEAIDVAPGSIVYIPTGVSYKVVNSGQQEMICTEVSHPSH